MNEDQIWNGYKGFANDINDICSPIFQSYYLKFVEESPDVVSVSNNYCNIMFTIERNILTCVFVGKVDTKQEYIPFNFLSSFFGFDLSVVSRQNTFEETEPNLEFKKALIFYKNFLIQYGPIFMKSDLAWLIDYKKWMLYCKKNNLFQRALTNPLPSFKNLIDGDLL